MRFSVLYISLMATLLLSCGKKEYSATQIIGHAANGLTVPHSIYCDNTEESIKLALSHIGCDGLELDVQMDKDGQLWLFHDETVARTSLQSGSVPDYSTQELAEATYTTFFKECLVQLKDYVLQWTNGKHLFFNTKIYHHTTHSMVDVALYIQRLEELRDQSPEYPFSLITNNRQFAAQLKAHSFRVVYDVEGVEDLSYAINNASNWDGVCISYKLVNKEEVQHLKNLGLTVALSGIRSPKAVRAALASKPDFILVDDIKTAITEKY